MVIVRLEPIKKKKKKTGKQSNALEAIYDIKNLSWSWFLWRKLGPLCLLYECMVHITTRLYGSKELICNGFQFFCGMNTCLFISN